MINYKIPRKQWPLFAGNYMFGFLLLRKELCRQRIIPKKKSRAAACCWLTPFA